MKRWECGWGFTGVRLALSLILIAGFGFASGCAKSPEIEDPVAAADPDAAPPPEQLAETLAPPPAAGGRLDVREIRVVDDNGQQGVFIKLTRPPASMNYLSLDHPSRLVIDLEGPTAGMQPTRLFDVKNPLIDSIRLGSVDGKTRFTVQLRTPVVPMHTVDALQDTVVAFLGEPHGTGGQVQEQVVYSRSGNIGSPVPARAAAENPAQVYMGAQVNHEAGGDAAPIQKKVYAGQRVSLDFKDADVHNVLRLLAEVSKLNIVATDDVTGKITLKLFDVPWDQALDLVLQALNLESIQEGNILRISTVRRLKEEREELRAAQDAAKAIEPLRVEYIRVNYSRAKNLALLIGGVDQPGSIQGGGRRRNETNEEGVITPRGSVMVDDFTNTLIVRDIQRGIENARELVRRLDVQTPQVLIESSIVEATTDFARNLGVQWGYSANIGPQTGSPTGVNFPGTAVIGGGSGLGPGGVPFLVDFPAGGNFANGNGSTLDMFFGSVDGMYKLNARLTALEEQGKGKVISRPRVVTLNNVPATIKSLTIIRVKLPSTGTVINTGAGGAAGGQSVATEKIETGIILTVTPLVSSDGFVLLDLQAKSSQADFARQVDSIPTEISREANSHILVKDGQTVVLGGIYRDTSSDNESGIPYLRSIPVLGWLFRAQDKAERREDLLVFLTPRVLTGSKSGLPTASDLWKNRNNPGEG